MAKEGKVIKEKKVKAEGGKARETGRACFQKGPNPTPETKIQGRNHAASIGAEKLYQSNGHTTSEKNCG